MSVKECISNGTVKALLGSRMVVSVALVLIGIFIGATIANPKPAEAEIREGPKQEAYLSGGARSEIVLKRIATVIERMDGRIERIEKILVKVSK